MQLKEPFAKYDRGALLVRDVHFGIAARCGRVHHRGYALKVQSYARPFRRTRQNYDGNLPAFKVLLVANSLVRSEQKINCRCLGRLQQIAVVQPVPSPCLRGDDGVAGKRTGKAPWRSVVKEDEHRRGRRCGPGPTP